jgi:hypothetical protein
VIEKGGFGVAQIDEVRERLETLKEKAQKLKEFL